MAENIIAAALYPGGSLASGSRKSTSINLAEATRSHQAAIDADHPPTSHVERVIQQLAARHAAALDLAHAAECDLLSSACVHAHSVAAALRGPALCGVQRFSDLHERGLLAAIRQLERSRSNAADVAPVMVFATEEQCQRHLLNWQKSRGWTCAECGSGKRCFLGSRKKFECVCGHQYPLTSGTIYQGSHVSLLVWFTVVATVLCRATICPSALAKKLPCKRTQTIRELVQKTYMALDSDDASSLLGGVDLIVLGHLPKVSAVAAASKANSIREDSLQTNGETRVRATTPPVSS